MSFNPINITLANYEECFILYMDNELSAEGRQQVENFVLGYPHLAAELRMLMSAKLPLEEVPFFHKDELRSAAMQMNSVEEELLLYVDGELAAPQKAAVKERISTDKTYAFQHAALLKTKLNPADAVPHPNKQELYRHAKRVVYFPVWMRVAVAVALLLSGSFFFLQNKNSEPVTGQPVAVKPTVKTPVQEAAVAEQKGSPAIPQQALVVAKTMVKRSPVPAKKSAVDNKRNNLPGNNDIVLNNLPEVKRKVIRFDVARFTATPDVSSESLNKTIAYTSVTSASTGRTTDNIATDDPESDGDFKNKRKTPAKGFFRKVSRFIERRTGIGTVNADNELLIGAVALKLK